MATADTLPAAKATSGQSRKKQQQGKSTAKTNLCTLAYSLSITLLRRWPMPINQANSNILSEKDCIGYQRPRQSTIGAVSSTSQQAQQSDPTNIFCSKWGRMQQQGSPIAEEITISLRTKATYAQINSKSRCRKLDLVVDGPFLIMFLVQT
eukprot:scaffold207325_cov32-Prasinocladus_malaysianus.AAC.1